jgi:CxxC motif-containing protein (DUF1111 family)
VSKGLSVDAAAGSCYKDELADIEIEPSSGRDRDDMGCSERQKEIRRRRHRRQQLIRFKGRAAKASVSEKAAIAAKLRDLTPGAEQVIQALQLEER